MKLYKERLLNSGQLKRLSDHKYSCTSISILDPILQVWWNWLVSVTPIWLAPNLITIAGLLVNIVTTLILVWYSPDAKTEPPRWACALCGLGLFIYQSLDAIDGKQARRTNTSSPLGELFDHGCDSISTIFVALSGCISVGLGYHPEWMFFQCFCAMTLFYCAHWQTYVSGTLRFGRIDVTEAQFTIIGIQVISCIFGPGIWSTKFFSDAFYLWYLIPISTFVTGTWFLYNMIIIIFTGGCGKNGSTVAVFNADTTLIQIMSIISVILYLGYFRGFVLLLGSFYCNYRSENGLLHTIAFVGLEMVQILLAVAVVIAILLAHANFNVIFGGGVGKNGSTVAGTSVISPIIPFSLVLVPAFIIYRKSVEQIYETHPALYVLAFGMVAAKVTNRLVVAHMTKSEMEYTDLSLVGPAMLFLNQYFNTFIPEYIVLWLCMIWVTFDLIRYCAQICLEICDHLHIELFRIPYPGGPMKPAQPMPSTMNNLPEKNGDMEIDSANEDRYPLLR